MYSKRSPANAPVADIIRSIVMKRCCTWAWCATWRPPWAARQVANYEGILATRSVVDSQSDSQSDEDSETDDSAGRIIMDNDDYP
jgi:hypothetical protein